MALVNRDKDSSEQISVWHRTIESTASGVSATIMNPGVPTGQTYVLMNVACPSQVSAASVAAYGLSGSPVVSLWVYRFAGGFTSFAIGQTLTVTAFGTSGALGVSLFGASNLLQTGDQLAVYTQVSNTAMTAVTVSVALKALQDIRSSFGATS